MIKAHQILEPQVERSDVQIAWRAQGWYKYKQITIFFFADSLQI